MKILNTIISLITACLLSPYFLLAEKLTLHEAFRIALSDNPRLKAGEWALEAQEKDVRLAKGRLFPKIEMEERMLRTDNPVYAFMAKLNEERFSQEDFMIDRLNNPDPLTDFQTSFSIEQPIFVPGIHVGIDLSKRELMAKRSEHERNKEEVALRVVRSFLAVQTAGEFVDVARKGLEDAEEHSRLAGLRYEAGLGLYSDVLRAGVAFKEAEAVMVSAESSLDISRRALGLILGRAEPVDAGEEKPVFDVEDLDIYLQASLQRQDLRALRLRQENSEKAVRMEQSIYLPEIGLGGSFQMNHHSSPFSEDGHSYLFMVSLKWHLFDAGIFDRVRKAQAAAHETEARLSGFEKEIHFRINAAYQRVREREKNLSFARTSVGKAEEALRIVRLAFENAHAPLVDLLDTQFMLDRTRAKAVEAENDYLTAIAELYYQSGLLMNELTGEPATAG